MPTQLLVFSDRRWDFVYHRPQHLLSRLAQRFGVTVVEEPVYGAPPPALRRFMPCPNLEVLRPFTPNAASGFHDSQVPVLEGLVARHLHERGADDHIAWLCTPMALPLVERLAPRAIVYDCPDPAERVVDPGPQYARREAALLRRADLVLTSGPTLQAARRAQHPNVHCLPSAVDLQYFARGRTSTEPGERAQAARLQARIGTPRIGYFGVIDERIDLDLLAATADADRKWQIVLTGPLVGVDPEALLSRPNIHWLGQQPHDLLPQLVAGWDICMLPFRAGAAASPTRALEFMAADKPVVASALPDVQALFSPVAEVVADAAGFVQACRRIFDEDQQQRAQRVRRMRELVAQHSWDSTAGTIASLLERLVAERPPARSRAPRPAVTVGPDPGRLTAVRASAETALPLSAAPVARIASGGAVLPQPLDP